MVFSFGLIAPLVSAPATSLPACCRNKGKHGCHSKSQHREGPAVQASRCAEFPVAQTLPTPIGAGAVPDAQIAFVLTVVDAAPAPVSAQPRTALSLTHSDRGPPSLLA